MKLKIKQSESYQSIKENKWQKKNPQKCQNEKCSGGNKNLYIYVYITSEIHFPYLHINCHFETNKHIQ